MSMLRRQVALGGDGGCMEGKGRKKGGLTSAMGYGKGLFHSESRQAANAGLAVYQAFRAANPGLPRAELSMMWKAHKMGAAPSAAGRRRPMGRALVGGSMIAGSMTAGRRRMLGKALVGGARSGGEFKSAAKSAANEGLHKYQAFRKARPGLSREELAEEWKAFKREEGIIRERETEQYYCTKCLKEMPISVMEAALKKKHLRKANRVMQAQEQAILAEQALAELGLM